MTAAPAAEKNCPQGVGVALHTANLHEQDLKTVDTETKNTVLDLLGKGIL